MHGIRSTRRSTFPFAAAIVAVIAATLFGCSPAEPEGQTVSVAEAEQIDESLSPDDLAIDSDDPAESATEPVTDEATPADAGEEPSDAIAEVVPDNALTTADANADTATADTAAPPGDPKAAASMPLLAPAAPYERPVDGVADFLDRTREEVKPKTPTLQPGMETKSFDRVDGAIRLSFDDLDLLKVLGVDKPIPLDIAASYPDWLADLDGRRVRLRGFMFPPYEPDGITQFALARDNEICCFGRDPLAYDILPVLLADGVTTEYIQARPFDVIGTFHHDTFPSDVRENDLMQLYKITDATIEQ